MACVSRKDQRGRRGSLRHARRHVDLPDTVTLLSSHGAVKSRVSAGLASFLVKNYLAIRRNGLRYARTRQPAIYLNWNSRPPTGLIGGSLQGRQGTAPQ